MISFKKKKSGLKLYSIKTLRHLFSQTTGMLYFISRNDDLIYMIKRCAVIQ
jgi:hypothetical protein